MHIAQDNTYLYCEDKVIAEKHKQQWYVRATTLNSLSPTGIDKTPVTDITMYLNDDEIEFLDVNGVL